MFKDIDLADEILGTPSAQKILRFLSCWELLTTNEIREMTLLSDSQIHLTLSNLIKINLIRKKRRGLYQMESSNYAQQFKNTYQAKIREYLNDQLYDVQLLLKKGKVEKAHEMMLMLEKHYEPILKKNFKFVLNSLAHQFLEYVSN